MRATALDQRHLNTEDSTLAMAGITLFADPRDARRDKVVDLKHVKEFRYK